MKPLIGCLFLLASFSSCTFTVTKPKPPEYAVNTDSLGKALDSLVSAVHINVNGKEIKKGDQTSSELDIEVINGRNIPDNDEKLRELGRTIGARFKNALKDPNQFDRYSVLFVILSTEKGVPSRTWKGNIFKSGEL